MSTVAMTFLFISLNLLAIKDGQESRELKLGGVLLLIVAFGFLMTSLFNTHVIGTPMSYRGLIHRISFEIVSAAFYPFSQTQTGVKVFRYLYRFDIPSSISTFSSDYCCV
jgi:hypothetical protein